MKCSAFRENLFAGIQQNKLSSYIKNSQVNANNIIPFTTPIVLLINKLVIVCD